MSNNSVNFDIKSCFLVLREQGFSFSLIMCMGFGCNACGVSGCRIIESERERLIAVITNVFVPCNGRFPAMISLITIFFTAAAGRYKNFLSAALLMLLIVAGIVITLLSSRLLSMTVLRGKSSGFVMELPPYRTPKIREIIIVSLFERTAHVLGRAVCASIPAGALIWLLANVNLDGNSLLAILAEFLRPAGEFIGLDGVILLGFILGFPANEIVLPIILMGYLNFTSLSELPTSDKLGQLLVANGWTWVTALCTLLFSLCHFPCATTLLTIHKETGSLRWTAFSFFYPLLIGVIICAAVSHLAAIFA